MLAVGIGGGGDAVGALAVAQAARAAGLSARVGGVTWERLPIDPLPGPRRLDEVTGAEPLNASCALAGPDTRGPGGFLFAEANLARALGEPVLLVDPNPGAVAVARDLAQAAGALGCDAVAFVDVGGDVLAHGDEPGLGSPLCDSVLLAAGYHLELPAIGALFGVGCDGELTPDEVLARLAEVARAGGLLGSWGITRADAEVLEAAVAAVPTEASAQAVRCARGAVGEAPIRAGRRTVPLSPLGAMTFFFDPEAAVRSAARLAAAVLHAPTLEDAEDVLAALGIRTELAAERAAAVVA